MKAKNRIAALTACIISVMSCMSLSAAATDYPDPNNDGVIDVSDVVYINSFLMGSFEPTDLTKLDFNGNYVISSVDSITLQRYLVNMEV